VNEKKTEIQSSLLDDTHNFNIAWRKSINDSFMSTTIKSGIFKPYQNILKSSQLSNRQKVSKIYSDVLAKQMTTPKISKSEFEKGVVNAASKFRKAHNLEGVAGTFSASYFIGYFLFSYCLLLPIYTVSNSDDFQNSTLEYHYNSSENISEKEKAILKGNSKRTLPDLDQLMKEFNSNKETAEKAKNIGKMLADKVSLAMSNLLDTARDKDLSVSENSDHPEKQNNHDSEKKRKRVQKQLNQKSDPPINGNAHNGKDSLGPESKKKKARTDNNKEINPSSSIEKKALAALQNDKRRYLKILVTQNTLEHPKEIILAVEQKITEQKKLIHNLEISKKKYKHSSYLNGVEYFESKEEQQLEKLSYVSAFFDTIKNDLVLAKSVLNEYEVILENLNEKYPQTFSAEA
jgi:hypothetical protein